MHLLILYNMNIVKNLTDKIFSDKISDKSIKKYRESKDCKKKYTKTCKITDEQINCILNFLTYSLPTYQKNN